MKRIFESNLPDTLTTGHFHQPFFPNQVTGGSFTRFSESEFLPCGNIPGNTITVSDISGQLLYACLEWNTAKTYSIANSTSYWGMVISLSSERTELSVIPPNTTETFSVNCGVILQYELAGGGVARRNPVTNRNSREYLHGMETMPVHGFKFDYNLPELTAGEFHYDYVVPVVDSLAFSGGYIEVPSYVIAIKNGMSIPMGVVFIGGSHVEYYVANPGQQVSIRSIFEISRICVSVITVFGGKIKNSNNTSQIITDFPNLGIFDNIHLFDGLPRAYGAFDSSLDISDTFIRNNGSVYLGEEGTYITLSNNSNYYIRYVDSEQTFTMAPGEQKYFWAYDNKILSVGTFWPGFTKSS